MENDREPME